MCVRCKYLLVNQVITKLSLLMILNLSLRFLRKRKLVEKNTLQLESMFRVMTLLVMTVMTLHGVTVMTLLVMTMMTLLVMTVMTLHGVTVMTLLVMTVMTMMTLLAAAATIVCTWVWLEIPC